MSNTLLRLKYKIKNKMSNQNWEKAYFRAVARKSVQVGHELKNSELGAFRNYWTDRALNLRDRHLFVPEGFEACEGCVACADVVTMRNRATGEVCVVFSTESDAEDTAIKAHGNLIEGLDYIGWKMCAADGEWKVISTDRLPDAAEYDLSDESLWKKVSGEIAKSYDIRVKSFFEIHKEADPQDYPELLKNWYKAYTGENLNLENPDNFNEKIQWLKLYDATEEKALLADKYEVRKFVADKIGEDYLIKLLGVYDDPDDIPFNQLPDKFVIKANHGCKFNIIVPDKSKLDIEKTKKTLKKWLDTDFSYNFLEMHYSLIKPRLVVEEYLENNNAELYDYKVYCFGGEPEFIQFIADRKEGKRMAFYDTDWKLQPFISNGQLLDRELERPVHLKEMLDAARVLSQGFCMVRVDFYVLNDGTLKFGELTFTPGTGALKWQPAEYNKIMGDKIILPEKK